MNTDRDAQFRIVERQFRFWENLIDKKIRENKPDEAMQFYMNLYGSYEMADALGLINDREAAMSRIGDWQERIYGLR